MSISRLYLKLFLAFVAVLIAADAIVFSIVLSNEMPPPMIRNLVEKAELGAMLIQREMEGKETSPQAIKRTLTPLLKLLGKGFNAHIWLTDDAKNLIVSNFEGTPPEVDGELSPVTLEGTSVKLFAIHTNSYRRIYIEMPMVLRNQPPLTTHVLMGKRQRKEEVWFFKGLLLLTALSALFIIPVSRRITRPILQLSEAADRLGKGDFSQRVPEKGKDEVAVLARKFNRMANHLEEMVKSGKELTAHVSHELRSPLARMRISLQLIMERDTTSAKDTLDRQVAKIENEIENMDAIIGHLLAFSKLDLREPPPRTDSIDVAQCFQHKIDQFDTMIEQKALTVTTSLEGIPGYVCNAHAISVVLENLLGNAIKYTAPNGTMSARVALHDGNIEINLSNSHAPLSKKDLVDMFTPFQRLDKGREAGTGLGLAATKKIVEKHGGTIQATYESGCVCMNITLPYSY